MSVSHSRGWTRFDKYKYSELLGLSQYQYKWKLTIIFTIGTHHCFHNNWLDNAYTLCGDNTPVPKLVYTLYIEYIVSTWHIMYFHKFSCLVILVCWSVIHCFFYSPPQTYIGSVVISMNPYKSLPIYTAEKVEEYRNRNFYELSPHMWV